MNRHFIVPDKFFNTYIEDIYTLGLEHENRIYVVETTKQGWLTTNREVQYVENDVDAIKEILCSFQPDDKIFISWYSSTIATAVLQSKIKNRIFVYLMGGDFYAEPIEWHADWLFDKLTLKKIKTTYFPQIKWIRKNPLHWHRIIGDFDRVYKHRTLKKQAYQRKLHEVERIDYIVLPPQAGVELRFVKHLYPTCRAKHAYGVFDQNFDMASQMCATSRREGNWRILFGNSADPTNNYIDGFRHLVKALPNVDVYSILSYGDPIGKEWALEAGREILGEGFHPITEYKPRADYLNFLMDMDAIAMYHNRQQAVGNIMTALVLGKPVFMKRSNIVYGFLKSIGDLPVYDISLLNEQMFVKSISEAQIKRTQTITLIEKLYSNRLRLELLKNLLTQ